jgi:hypothetical protein
MLHSKRVGEEYFLTVAITKYKRRKVNSKWGNDTFQVCSLYSHWSFSCQFTGKQLH